MIRGTSTYTPRLTPSKADSVKKKESKTEWKYFSLVLNETFRR